MSEVSLVKGKNRQENIKKALDLIKKNIIKDIKSLKKTDYILIKPNLFTAKNLQDFSCPESLETLLMFLRDFYKGRIIVGEGTSIGSTHEAFKRWALEPLAEKFDIELIDLNHDDGLPVDAFDRNLKPIKVLVSKTAANSAYTISLSPIKTHNTVILSLSIENMVTGCLIKGNIKNKTSGYKMLFRRNFQDYKSMVSQNPTSHNLSIASIIKNIMPNMAIIDGFTSMERNGPVGGKILETNLALASTDPICLDTLTAYITGFDPGKIGYLHHLQFASHEIKILGNRISDCRIKLRPPDTLQEQLKWYNTKGK